MRRAGLQAGLHLAMALPLAVLVWRWGLLAQGAAPRLVGLSAEPVDYTINYLGLWALRALWACLAITPLRRAGLGAVAAWRRPLGLWAFAYACLHLAVYFALDLLGSPAALWADVAKHPFILLGMAGWGLLLPLALTSNRAMIRRLKARAWQRLHRLVYAAGALVAVHFILRVKGFQAEPWLYALLLAGLLAARLPLPARRRLSAA